MLNQSKLHEYIEKYKNEFSKHWDDERFKWECVKCFQDNWDINAENFYDMFTKSTEKAYNLLASMNNFPRGMIQIYSEQEPETIRAMFISLFDESKPVADRVLKFISDSDDICNRLSPGKQHYQRPMAITVYLWMRYPDKYDIYKYSLFKKETEILEWDFKPIKGHTKDNMLECFKLNDAIVAEMSKETDFINEYRASLDEKCWPDASLRMLSTDFRHFISTYMQEEESDIDAKQSEKQATDEVAAVHDGVDGTVNYWWLNANPKIWSFSGISVGELQDYTLYNDNGNKRRIFQNFLDVRVGDKIIGYESTPVKQITSLAEITQENDGHSICFKKVEGLASPIDYAVLKDIPELANMEYFGNPQGSLFKLTKQEYDTILDIIREENPLNSGAGRNGVQESKLEKYTKDDFLSDVYMEESKYDTLRNLLMNKQNLIMQGAPGVGKTFAAKRLAYSIMGEKDDSRVEFIQFHQNYSYEDFVMGYKPNGDGFELKKGIFYTFCIKAENNPDKPYFFIIDEINRGNMSKIFGELLMLIEKDYRGSKATLAYNGLQFSVPKNLYIIGMMNTADRSLAMIDYALRRRFSFFSMEPGFSSDGFVSYANAFNNETFTQLIEYIRQLNIDITKDPTLGSGFCIGHSYFCGQTDCTDDWMQSVVEYDIIPMLEEYWFDEPNKLQKWQNILRGVFND